MKRSVHTTGYPQGAGKTYPITGPDIDYDKYCKVNTKNKNILKKIKLQLKLAEELAFTLSVNFVWPEAHNGKAIAYNVVGDSQTFNGKKVLNRYSRVVLTRINKDGTEDVRSFCVSTLPRAMINYICKQKGINQSMPRLFRLNVWFKDEAHSVQFVSGKRSQARSLKDALFHEDIHKILHELGGIPKPVPMGHRIEVKLDPVQDPDVIEKLDDLQRLKLGWHL